jgi:CRP-like cAMP-binding protein
VTERRTPRLRHRRSSRQTIDRLRRSPLFQACSERGLRTVAHAATEVVIPPRWAFLHEATPAHAAYLLLDGDALVFHGRVPVATVGTGDVVGEMGLVHSRLRTATVTSCRRVTALRIAYADLEQLMTDEPAVAADYAPW